MKQKGSTQTSCRIHKSLLYVETANRKKKGKIV